MQFHTESEPTRGVAHEIVAGVRRVVADNPGPMTYHGTNTYLIETTDGFAVVDPGPNSSAHIRAILNASQGRITRILLTHTHRDHYGAAAIVKAETGAPSYGRPSQGGNQFSPDCPLFGGETIADMTAIYTPGHADDHLCFALPGGVLFTGDHVMPWSTSLVAPPGGNMAAYLTSLRLMLNRSDRLYLSGHGPPLYQPRPLVEQLLKHRSRREDMILTLLRSSPKTAGELARLVYPGIDQRVFAAATRNVLAHLLKLQMEGRVLELNDLWHAGSRVGEYLEGVVPSPTFR